MNTPLIQGQEIHGTPTLVRNKTVSFLMAEWNANISRILA
jgi:hypothetical protein